MLLTGIDSKRLLNTLREQDHMVFGGGQQHLDGKIFRVGHLGFFEEVDLVEAMDTMEMRLQAFGFTAEMRGRWNHGSGAGKRR